ncbi:doublecortin domain-containing protein 2-like [Cheilinus undulatus]|uniref:doublecortin domain-containing protein 2-like n=1 Tax=Cheilinus undulatus TaxID=241271 RepID=UPI001BD4933F|nr:doublecortin domain-containing protein 2-like [Cheilinus undulatus]
MSSEKPNFLSQPIVKNVFMYRNGDPYYEARRIVINQKRVSNFETLLREVTGGIQAPFGAVRNIYTPRGGHKVDCLESLQSGEQYVAAGREKFKRLDYLQIGSRKRRLMQTLPVQAKPLPPNRIIVSARFLKPIKEPCTIFVVANGDVLNPAVRLLIHQRMLSQFDKILEMITEKMGLRVLGGVRSLYTYEGNQVTDGNQLESGQLYVAAGRERFKKLPYSDLLFTKPRGTRRVNGIKAHSLPPIYRFSKQNGNAKSTVRCSDSGDGDSKASPPAHTGNNKEHLSSIVREISQARLISLRKKRSGQSMTLGIADNDELESKADDGNTEDKTPQDQPAEEKPAADDTKAAEEKEEEKEEAAADKNTTEEDTSASAEQKENQETNSDKEDKKEGEETAGVEEKEEEEEIKGEVTDEGKEEVKSEVQGSESNSDKTQESEEKEDGSHRSSEGENNEHDTNEEEEKQDKDSRKGEKKSKDQVNDVDTGEKEKETENSSDPEQTRSDNDTKESDKRRSSSSNSNQEDDASKTKEAATKEKKEEERKMNGEVSGEDDEVESEAELDVEGKNEASRKDATSNEGKEKADDEESEGKSKKEKD